MGEEDIEQVTSQDPGATLHEAHKAEAESPADMDWDAAFAEARAAEAGKKQAVGTGAEETAPVSKQEPASNVGSPHFDDFSGKRPIQRGDRSLDFLLDIPLEVSVELGRTRMIINDLLQMGQGAIIELNKLAGEPVEVFVNGRLLGKGEVVVVDDKFGVRLMEIISPAERIRNLG
ncbi:MAG: flagellar motor switch protein FliN [Thermodesulfobacteriota bacterium]